MLFNSFEFGAFLVAVFCGYWTLGRLGIRWQNFLLLICSYVFYGCWDWRFLSLIWLSSIVDYSVGLGLLRSESPRRRQLLLFTSVALNIGILGYFKYAGFFIDSFADLLTSVGFTTDLETLNIVLPVGISFYTFQTMSYTIDVYRRKISPTRDALSFFTFVAFFPQLVAGPIERAANLLTQFQSPRLFDRRMASDGLRQILWGLFKKVVIADNLAQRVDRIFTNYESASSPEIWLGLIFFSVQIYCDFSGYSLIARGTAQLLGFRLMRNFAYPYFSRNLGEFWKRWHISLSTWFRDYLYIPLGGSHVTRFRRCVNVVLVFCVSGFWHGANWTFLAWGLIHGLCYLPMHFMRFKQSSPYVAQNRLLPTLREIAGMILTNLVVLVAWTFFRAKTVPDAIQMIAGAFRVEGPFLVTRGDLARLGAVLILFTVEWIQRGREHALDVSGLPFAFRWSVYYMVLAMIFFFGKLTYAPFIYFQF